MSIILTKHRPAVAGVEPSVTITLPLHSALCFAAISGHTPANFADGGLHAALSGHPLYTAYKAEREQWIEDKANGLSYDPTDRTAGWDVDGTRIE